MLPITAIPSAMPISVAVSEVAAAAPVFSGGAEPITRSVPRIIIGMMPMPSNTVASTISPGPG